MKHLRLTNNYTQEYIAHELGISQKAYSKIENGEVCLSLDKMNILAEIYQVPPFYFCENSCNCINSDLIQQMKDYLSKKGVALPSYLHNQIKKKELNQTPVVKTKDIDSKSCL